MSRHRNTLQILFLAFLLLSFGASCVTDKTALYAPRGSAVLLQRTSDPLEGYNRIVQDFNQGVENAVVHPAAQVWRALTPDFLRTGLSNFSDNLGYPLRVVNHLLQGDLSASWNDTKRFAANTTAGILGLWDPATKWGMPRQDTSFGDTFAKWGIGKGCYLNLPILGPGTLRDAAGKVADFPLNIPRLLLSSDEATIVNAILEGNTITRSEASLYTLFSTQYNDYELFKFSALVGLDPELKFKPVPKLEDPDPDDSFGILMLAPGKPEFFYKARQRKVKTADGSVVPYTCYPSRNASTLVVILPGIGSHRNSLEVAALAELFRGHGCDTLALSSTFTPDYFEGLSTDAPPGVLYEDAKLLAPVVDAAIADYREHYRIPEGQRCVMLGYSLGGLNLLHLVAAQKRGTVAPLPVDRYLAINPPFDPQEALRTVDRMAAIPESWGSDEECNTRVETMVDRLSIWMGQCLGGEQPAPMPVTREESRYLMGIYMRARQVATLQALERRSPSGVFQENPRAYFHRNNFFAEALGFTYDDYINKILAAWYLRNGSETDFDAMGAACRLDALTEELRDADNTFVFQNRNDFLINERDLEWYEGTFGSRCTLFDRGGHLGTMAMPEYQQALVKVLLD